MNELTLPKTLRAFRLDGDNHLIQEKWDCVGCAETFEIGDLVVEETANLGDRTLIEFVHAACAVIDGFSVLMPGEGVTPKEGSLLSACSEAIHDAQNDESIARILTWESSNLSAQAVMLKVANWLDEKATGQHPASGRQDAMRKAWKLAADELREASRE
mgnify:CR=1 FL=1